MYLSKDKIEWEIAYKMRDFFDDLDEIQTGGGTSIKAFLTGLKTASTDTVDANCDGSDNVDQKDEVGNSQEESNYPNSTRLVSINLEVRREEYPPIFGLEETYPGQPHERREQFLDENKNTKNCPESKDWTNYSYENHNNAFLSLSVSLQSHEESSQNNEQNYID